jgi:hypothetical protein
MQNRKSAKKCRLKKKAEFSILKGDVDAIANENIELKAKVRLINYYPDPFISIWLCQNNV